MPAFDGTIREIVRENDDTVTLRLSPSVPVAYRAGQFISIDPHRIPALAAKAAALEEQKQKKERPRAYSLASAPHEPLLAITVKEEPSGPFPSLMTPWFVREAKVGDTLACTGPAGIYALPPSLPPGARLVHICAGTGLVPDFGIIKDTLHRGLDVHHTVLLSNRTASAILYGTELRRLLAGHPDRLRIVHFLTRDDAVPAFGEVVRHRIDRTWIEQALPGFADAWVFVCGPSATIHERREAKLRGEAPTPRFLEQMVALAKDLGVAKERLFHEGW